MAVLTAALLLACERPSEDELPADDESDPHGPFYPPWVIEVRGENLPFDEISFKDVGMSHVPAARRAQVYEAIVRALSAELEAHEALSASVRHSEAAARPEWHQNCVPRHLYVDLWQDTNPERWGYSLASGCTAEQRFARREIPRSAGPDDRATIDVLARSMEDSVHEALRTGCFRRSCE